MFFIKPLAVASFIQYKYILGGLQNHMFLGNHRRKKKKKKGLNKQL